MNTTPKKTTSTNNKHKTDNAKTRHAKRITTMTHRETRRDTHTHRDTETHTEPHTETHTDTHRDTHRHTNTDTNRHKHRKQQTNTKQEQNKNRTVLPINTSVTLRFESCLICRAVNIFMCRDIGM